MAELTPMMRQYMEEKEKHPDSLLFFRLGDFYEMFGPDARTASRELDLALTTRDKDKSKSDEERIPMCGVPYHSAEGYIARLIAKGYKVSICEQMEDPALAKGLVKREIIRTVTPGTVLDEACLDAGRSNYLCGVYLTDTAAGLCAADISTGQAQVTAFTGAQRLTGLINELGRFAPAEAVLNPGAAEDTALRALLEDKLRCHVERLPAGRFQLPAAEKRIRQQFALHHAGGGLIRTDIYMGIIKQRRILWAAIDKHNRKISRRIYDILCAAVIRQIDNQRIHSIFCRRTHRIILFILICAAIHGMQFYIIDFSGSFDSIIQCSQKFIFCCNDQGDFAVIIGYFDRTVCFRIALCRLRCAATHQHAGTHCSRQDSSKRLFHFHFSASLSPHFMP